MFKRELSGSDIREFEMKWAPAMGLPIQKSALAQWAQQICQIEAASKGRLAGDIQDAVLRALAALSIPTESLDILEIGVLFGVNAAALHSLARSKFKSVRLTLIDPLNGYYQPGERDVLTGMAIDRETVEHNLQAAGVPPQDYQILQAYSNDPAALAAAAQQKYHFIFIDGDHSYEGVRGDFERYAPLLAEDGYLVFDNYLDGTSPGVDRFINEDLLNAPVYQCVGAGWRTIIFKKAPLAVAQSAPARLVTLTGLDARGCTFEVANPVESFRIEQYGSEEEFTRAMLQAIRPGDVFYDIGACVGLVSVHAAKIAAQVIAFEPDPAARARLQTNIALNALTNVTVLDWAVSDAAGEVTLFTDPGGRSASLRDFGERAAVTVRTGALDAALARGELPAPDVVKIDIEGAELLALQGMKQLLASRRAPRAIFLELHPDFLPQFSATTEQVVAFLEHIGYRQAHFADRNNQSLAIFTKPAAADGIELLAPALLAEHRPIVEQFRELAQTLDRVVGWHYLLDLAWIASQLPDPRGMTILDAGAGVGLLQWWLAERGATVISVDRSPRKHFEPVFHRRFRIRGLRPEDQPASSAPGAAPASAGEVLIYNADLTDLAALADGSVDCVVSVSALEHNTLDGLKLAVAELERVLKPGSPMLATLSAGNQTDWYHEPSKGWVLTEAALRQAFDLPTAPSNFDQFDAIFDSLCNCAELRDNLHPFYFSSGDNGMPWGVWQPQYQPVGIRKLGRRSTPPKPAAARYQHSKEQVLAASRAALAQFKDAHKGGRCVIIGNGPSLNRMDLSFLKNEITLGMNRIYLGFERWGFTPTYYVSVNPLVIEQSAAEILKIPAPRFLSHHGIPFFPDPSQALFVESLDAPGFARDPRLGWWEGYTVTYAALQLAYFMGFSEVVLIGVDHSFSAPGKPNQEVVSGGSDANHFDPNYFGKGVRWHLPDLKNSEFAYTLAQYAYRADGRTILDATVDGKLTVFPKADYRQLFFGESPAGGATADDGAPAEGASPLVSVILPRSGNPALFRQALESIERQTYPNLEVIAVSDDDSAIETAGLSRPLTRISLGEKASLGMKLNAGLALARGETIAYLSEGERYLPDHLAVLQLTLQHRPQFVAAYAQVGREAPAAAQESAPPQRRSGAPEQPFDFDQLLVSNYIPLSCLAHRRAALGKTGGFDENLPTQVGWDFLIRLGLAGKFDFLPAVSLELLDAAPAALPDDGAWAQAYRAICRRYASHAAPAVRQAQQALLQSLGAAPDPAADAAPSLVEWPDEVAAWVEQANAAAAQGDFAAAIEPLRQALDRLPADAWLNVTLGNVLLNAGQFADARRQFAKTAVFHPQNGAAQQGLGAALWQLGESEKALAAFRRALALTPEDENLRALILNLEAAPPPSTPAPTAHVTPAEAEPQASADIPQIEMKNLQNHWNTFGERDPMWAILTRADKKGNRWQPGEFFETGIHDIAGLFSELSALGIPFARRAALDFGCGVGRLTQALAMQFEAVVGIDIAPSMIEEAQRHNRFGARCQYRVNAANDLRMFADGQFDLIYTIITLQHIRPQYSKNYLREFLRVLSAEGVLVFQLPSRRRDGSSSRLPGVLTFEENKPVMEMHGIEKGEVLQLIAENGGHLLHIQEDTSLGSDWESYKYFVSKPR